MSPPRTYYLHSKQIMDNCIAAIRDLPIGFRVSFSEPKRSLVQNDRMWAMLGKFSKQADLHGNKYAPEDWKLIFMHALGRELRMAPALDGRGFVPIGSSTSNLSVREMSDMIDLIYSEGATRGVVFKEPDQGREF